MRCVWVKAYERSDKLPLWREHFDHLRPPVDNSLQGTSSWKNLVTGRDRQHAGRWLAGCRRLRTSCAPGERRRSRPRCRRSTAAACAEVRRQLAPMQDVARRGQRDRQHGRPRARLAARGRHRAEAVRRRADHAARLPRPQPARAAGRHRRRRDARHRELCCPHRRRRHRRRRARGQGASSTSTARSCIALARGMLAEGRYLSGRAARARAAAVRRRRREPGRPAVRVPRRARAR